MDVTKCEYEPTPGCQRHSFAGHTLETQWTTLQLAYFVGTAMWTYLTQPFTFALPGFESTEHPRRQVARRTTHRLDRCQRGRVHLTTHVVGPNVRTEASLFAADLQPDIYC
jgi:hypothetical protein